jgi:hypothetical protein
MNKRGQAAMEFLMTYGWAILVVLAAIAALAYFGVLSPDKFIPEKCILPSGIACLDSSLKTSGATIVIQNAMGIDMTDITLTISGSVECSGSTSSPATLDNGEKGTFQISCTPTSGSRVNADLSLDYTNKNTGVSHKATGSIIKRVQ